MLRDVAILAVAAMRATPTQSARWSAADAAAVRSASARLVRRQSDAFSLLGPAAKRLVDGIALRPYLPPQGGPFGPGWPGHPFASSAFNSVYRMREADVTREFAHLMSPAGGPRGPQRAVSFLRVVAHLTGQKELEQALTDEPRVTVIAEHPVGLWGRKPGMAARSGPSAPLIRRGSPPRIDLLFELPMGSDGRRAVVVVEAKLGAVVAPGQLTPYTQEARRRARGGPVTRVLLTVRRDEAERRNRSWHPVRWFALMRRWEAALAAAGDHDAEFARVRAHVWRFLLDNRGSLK